MSSVSLQVAYEIDADDVYEGQVIVYRGEWLKVKKAEYSLNENCVILTIDDYDREFEWWLYPWEKVLVK